MPADPNCPKCHGAGHIYLDAMSAKRCGCLLRRLYAAKMGMTIYRSKPVKTSNLAKKLTSNLYLLYDDEDVNPHLKVAFAHLGLDYNWIYIDDSNVLQAWLNKPNSAGAENLHDLTEYPFMVLRLGTIGYPNKALPGVLCELLQSRILAGHVTWIVSSRDLKPDTCREYSEELEMMVGRHFEKMTPKKQRPPLPLRPPIEVVRVEGVVARLEDMLPRHHEAEITPVPAVNANVNDLLRKRRGRDS